MKASRVERVLAVNFLIGGLGNQLFQFAASRPEDTFSALFLSPAIRKRLNWTQHEQFLTYPSPNLLWHGMALVMLALDAVLVKTIRLSLFTTFDTQRIKVVPKLFELVRAGYFQDAPERRDVAELAAQLAPSVQAGRIVLHVRGGDLLVIEAAGQNTYGMVGAAYYRRGIAAALAAIKAQNPEADIELMVVTDDADYAATLDLSVPGAPAPQIRALPLGQTLSVAIGADWFVSSNSTMAYWIVRLREGARSVAPQPFQKRRDYPLPESVLRVAMDAT